MTSSSKYLVDKIKQLSSYNTMTPNLVFKNFYVTSKEEQIWFDEDVEDDMVLLRKTIVGVSYEDDEAFAPTQWFRTSMISLLATYKPFIFDFAWNKIGTYIIPLDEALSEQFDGFIDAIYAQLLLVVNGGYNVYLGRDIVFKKNTAYDILIETDLLS